MAAPETLNSQTNDTLNIENAKNVAGSSAVAMSMLYQTMQQAVGMSAQNSVSNQNQQFMIGNLLTATIANKLIHLDPSESASLLKLFTGNEPASQITAILAALAAGQMGGKQGDNAPPQTGTQTPGTA